MSEKELLRIWYRRLRESQFAHYEAAKALSWYNYWLGIPAIALSAFVGTSVFAAIGKAVDPRLQIFVGLVSVAAAMLTSIQTFLRFSERAEKHRTVASRFGALRREIEEVLIITDRNVSKETLTALREQIDKLGDEAPGVPSRVWSKIKEGVDEGQFMREYTSSVASDRAVVAT